MVAGTKQTTFNGMVSVNIYMDTTSRELFSGKMERPNAKLNDLTLVLYGLSE